MEIIKINVRNHFLSDKNNWKNVHFNFDKIN
jgi:hypothetical protein